jgi:hypothetical protein
MTAWLTSCAVYFFVEAGTTEESIIGIVEAGHSDGNNEIEEILGFSRNGKVLFVVVRTWVFFVAFVSFVVD